METFSHVSGFCTLARSPGANCDVLVDALRDPGEKQ